MAVHEERAPLTQYRCAQCGYGAVYNSHLGLYFKHRACSSTFVRACPKRWS